MVRLPTVVTKEGMRWGENCTACDSLRIVFKKDNTTPRAPLLYPDFPYKKYVCVCGLYDMTIASYSLARPPFSRTAQSTMSGGRTEDLTDGWPQILQISKVETDQGYGTAAQGRRQTPPPPALRCWIYHPRLKW